MTLAQAEAAANDHHYAEADRLLASFAARNSGSDEALEVAFWRGLLQLDPENHDGSAQSAVALFDVYLKSDGPLAHRLEAQVLRHIATRFAALAGASGGMTVAAGAQASGDRAADSKAKDAEIQRLKDELAKANDELERIKRRLAAPTKPD
jgi:hypothetical protein